MNADVLSLGPLVMTASPNKWLFLKLIHESDEETSSFVFAKCHCIVCNVGGVTPNEHCKEVMQQNKNAPVLINEDTWHGVQ